MTSTRSASRAARRISAASASGSSGCTSLTTGTAPTWRHRPASMSELVSKISPGPRGRAHRPDLVPGGNDRHDRRPRHGNRRAPGRRRRGQVARPQPAARPGRAPRPPRSPPRPAGRSSPAPARGRRPTAAMMTLPSSCGSSHSRITTVSAPSGIGVSGVDPREGSRPAAAPRRRPRPDRGAAAYRRAARPARTAAETAMPSIAEQSDRGDGQRATIGLGAHPAERVGHRRPLGGRRGVPARPLQRVEPDCVGERRARLGATGWAHDPSRVVMPRPGARRCRRSWTGRAGSRSG